VLPTHQHALKIGTEVLPETSENLHILTRLSARENFIDCILNLPQTTNNTQFNVFIMNHLLSLTLRDLLENIFLFHVGPSLKTNLLFKPIFEYVKLFINPSSRQNFQIIVTALASQIFFSHEMFENKFCMFNRFFLSKSLAVDFIIRLSCDGK